MREQCCNHTCREGRDCPRRRPVANPLSALWRAWLIVYFRWARHDLQRRDAAHPDLPYIVHRLRDLEGRRG